uniref:Gamma-glutamyl kinase n=1 Tax=Paulinella chromatophora TaxID=39717 RepID=B1X3P3_PAUCH|nr:gamma-glutamyl kinase [Paulinella chromatophora]ACB42562.1 gamma-glutamyl kinase [Paulinella chromatophora]
MVKRRVIKVGTSLLRGTYGRDTRTVIADLARSLAAEHSRQNLITLVTSGAVGLGCDSLNLIKRPTDVLSLQAAASIGQGRLITLYDAAFSEYNIRVGQVLLTRGDLASKRRYQNASRTLSQLLNWGAIPIVNENDTLATDELRFGDNDTLSALIAIAIKADELILLTDVEQLYSSDPRQDSNARPIDIVYDLAELEELESHTNGSEWGTGGITTKLAAARIATASGVRVRLADGRDPTVLDALFKGEARGTVFEPNSKLMGDRQSWLAHAIKIKGELTIDNESEKALLEGGASLLISGIINVRGTFGRKNTVRLVNLDGKEIAKGICIMSSQELEEMLEISNYQLERSFAYIPIPIVINKEQLILSIDTLQAE